MDDALIVAMFTVIDDVMRTLGHQTHPLAGASDREVLTVAVVAACQFANNHERTLGVMQGMHYLSGALSRSRFNRRLHALAPGSPLSLTCGASCLPLAPPPSPSTRCRYPCSIACAPCGAQKRRIAVQIALVSETAYR